MVGAGEDNFMVPRPLFRQHQEQENFDGEDEEDVANLLPDSFDLGIADEFSDLDSLDEAAFHAAFDVVEQERFPAGLKKTGACWRSLAGCRLLSVEPSLIWCDLIMFLLWCFNRWK